MSEPTGIGTFDRLAALVRQLTAAEAPPQPDWHRCIRDVLGDLEWIAARTDRWPDAGLQAVSAAMSLANVFLPTEEVEKRRAGALDFAAMTWTCMVCGDTRPAPAISVAHRLSKGLENMFPAARWNVRYCNDRPGCAGIAHQAGVWTGPPLRGPATGDADVPRD